MGSIEAAARKYPTLVPEIQYGTAGFRTVATVLEPILFRMGILAVLRARFKKALIGVMITASHNPEQDNGVKLIDPLGEMLEQRWEHYATTIANVSSEHLTEVVQSLVNELGLTGVSGGHVGFARDTRPSGPALVAALIDGIVAAGGSYTDYGVTTTPQLHYIVRCVNTNNAYGEPSLEGYHEKLAASFMHLYYASGATTPVQLKLDCANGVGAISIKQFLEYCGAVINVQVCNDGSSGKLNDKCGADFLKVQQRAPSGMNVNDGDQCASFDGDADRLMFFSTKQGVFYMLDGDRIAILLVEFISELLANVGLTLNIGIVQTAYANGASTKYLTDVIKVPVACVNTGVKYLHHRAQEYDVGVYFEANGHGTVLFSDAALAQINAIKPTSEEHGNQIANLRAFIDLTNQTVGDALSDLLLVEAVLLHKKISIEQWSQSYQDLPNRQLKVSVKDRSVITTTDAERICVTPDGLQAAINALVQQYPCARSFVRPSGTEDVVRVYAEADTRENTDKLATEVAQKVYELAGGAGSAPSHH